jgi:hypothetical protein
MVNSTELLEVLPDPVALIESMRAVGYSLEAAIADIVDNSLSANARRVSIAYDATKTPYVAILDDGDGMTSGELTEAMRHGRNPADQRPVNDLGRFGLGLKTASLSQGRRLTVISKQGASFAARCWDLDTVADTHKWVVEVPPTALLKKLPLYEQLSAQVSGTLVVWEDLDRLISDAEDPRAELTLNFSPLEDHLALVFHRFVAGDAHSPSVEILLNGRPLPRRDPFLVNAPFTQPLEPQVISSELGRVLVTPFVLPPAEKLSSDQIELAGGRDGLKNSQGFYIYRGRRLVIWGTWFRLTPKNEFFKLCRVQVDVPNSFDALWNLDIKKSAATPPSLIRNRLKELIPRFQGRSKTTVTYRGRRQKSASFCPVWLAIEEADGSLRFQVNTEHPLVTKLADGLSPDQLKLMRTCLDVIGVAIPVDAIYADQCGDRAPSRAFDVAEYVDMARQICSITNLSLDEVLQINPFDSVPELHQQIRKGLS